MNIIFTDTELCFLRDGGNLWCVREEGDGQWVVIRWSRSGPTIVSWSHETRVVAEDSLYKLVHFGCYRGRAKLHHSVRWSPGNEVARSKFGAVDGENRRVPSELPLNTLPRF